MIVDAMRNSHLYKSVQPNVRKGLEFLCSDASRNLEPGRYEIDGDDVYAMVQTYETTPKAEKQYEAHRSYIDIQFIETGSETLYWMDVDTMETVTEYDREKDCLFLSTKNEVPILLDAGYFTVLYPDDAHKPGCNVDEAFAGNQPGKTVKKIVVKCRVS